jgi:TolA protein
MLLSLLFYSTGKTRRLSLPPVYTVDLIAPPADVERIPTVRKKRTPAQSVPTKTSTEKSQRKQDAIKKSVAKEQVKKVPLKTESKNAPPSQKKKSAEKNVTENERSVTDELQLRKTFDELKETDSNPKVDIKKDIAQLEAKLRLKQKELEIKAALKKIKKSTNLEDATTDLNPRKEQPQVKQESDTSSTIQEEIEKLKRERKRREKEKTISEAFNRLKEKERAISESAKEIAQKNEKSTLPLYKQREWDFDLKGDKGLSAQFREESISDEAASTIAKIIAARIESAWRVDEFLTMQSDYSSLKSVVSIRIGRNGKILGIIEEQISENQSFHKSVLAAIKESDPLPLEELNITGGFEVGLTFTPQKQ